MSSLFRGKTVLITGGSSGIGFDLAKLFLKDGSTVILTAADPEKLSLAAGELEKISGRKIHFIAKDLASSSAPKEIFDELASKKITVDALVNNAGFGVYGKVHELPIQKLEKMMDVNARAALSLTGLFLPGMVERGFGRILNVASTAAFQPIPIEATYAATKAFMLYLSEALSNELKGTGVGVTCLCPGPTETPFFSRGEIFPSKMMKRTMMASDAVARIGYEALQKGKSLAVPGLRNNIFARGYRFFPRTWVTQIARKVVE